MLCVQDGAVLDEKVFRLTIDKRVGPTTAYLNGELSWYQESADAPAQLFLGPSKMEWLEVTG